MKRLLFILCIITSSMVFSSCKTTIETSADIVICNSWSVSTPAGISAELNFDKPSCHANFSLQDSDGSKYVIKGIFAIDSENLYITSADFAKTYKFGYKAYNDSLKLEYNGTVLTFNNGSDKNKEP